MVVILGEMPPNEGDVQINAGRETTIVAVANTGDRPIQVGSHFQFFETNRALKFDREASYGMRLDIPAGTSVRFGPAEERDVGLVAIGGRGVVRGLNGLTAGYLDDPEIRGPRFGESANAVSCNFTQVQSDDKRGGWPMALPTMQKKNLDSGAEVDVHGRIKKETVTLDEVSVTRVTFGVGARWSEDLQEYAGTHSCELPHVALVQSGQLKVAMDDGSEELYGPQDVMMLPPGHDAWTVGEEPCVFVEFSRGNDYYEGT